MGHSVCDREAVADVAETFGGVRWGGRFGYRVLGLDGHATISPHLSCQPQFLVKPILFHQVQFA
jgi:hypothetical protein